MVSAAQKVSPGYGWRVGEAWGYRRHAYAAMATVLARERPKTAGLAAANMHAAVCGAEPASTKHYLTARTPPLSDAAKAAQAAMASVDQQIKRANRGQCSVGLCLDTGPEGPEEP